MDQSDVDMADVRPVPKNIDPIAVEAVAIWAQIALDYKSLSATCGLLRDKNNQLLTQVDNFGKEVGELRETSAIQKVQIGDLRGIIAELKKKVPKPIGK